MTKNTNNGARTVGSKALLSLVALALLAMSRTAAASPDEPSAEVRARAAAEEGVKLRHGLYIDLMLHSGFQPEGQPALCPNGGEAGCMQFGKTPSFGATFRLGYQFGWIGVELVGAGMADLHYGSLSSQTDTSRVPSMLSGAVEALTSQEYLIYNLGVFGGLGLRLTTPGRVAFTLGVAPGMAFHWYNVASLSGLETQTTGESRRNLGVQADAALLVGGRGAKLSLGVIVWIDFLGNEPSVPSSGGGRYSVGRSPSIFVGPSIGAHWGGA